MELCQVLLRPAQVNALPDNRWSAELFPHLMTKTSGRAFGGIQEASCNQMVANYFFCYISNKLYANLASMRASFDHTDLKI